MDSVDTLMAAGDSAWVDVGQPPADFCVGHNVAVKTELHRILNAFQHSQAYGIYVCASFRDPRQHHLDDYWAEVQDEAVSVLELHSVLGKTRDPLTEDARRKLYQLSRVLERLSKRLDRVVTAP